MSLWYAATASIPDSVWGDHCAFGCLRYEAEHHGLTESRHPALKALCCGTLPACRRNDRPPYFAYFFREGRASHLQNVVETLDRG